MDEKKEIGKYEKVAWRLLHFGLFLTLVILILFLWKRTYSLNLPINDDLFSAFGDVLGGVLGSIVALISFLLLYETLNEQRRQFLKQQDASEKALKFQAEQFKIQIEKNDLSFKIQQIENRFFELLKIQRDNANEISLRQREGRKVFITLVRELIEAFKVVERHNKEFADVISLDDVTNISYLCFFYGCVGDKSDRIIKAALTKYPKNYVNSLLSSFFEEQKKLNESKSFPHVPFEGHQTRLGHYFRHLYQTTKYINQIEKSVLTYNDKYHYIKTLRAQLTIQEQFLLLWNSLSDLGRLWEKGRFNENEKLITKYNLIKNIPYGFSLELEASKMYPYVQFEGQDISVKRIELMHQYH